MLRLNTAQPNKAGRSRKHFSHADHQSHASQHSRQRPHVDKRAASLGADELAATIALQSGAAAPAATVPPWLQVLLLAAAPPEISVPSAQSTLDARQVNARTLPSKLGDGTRADGEAQPET